MNLSDNVNQFGQRLKAQDEVTAEGLARGIKEARERLNKTHAELRAAAEKELADARAAGAPDDIIEEQLAQLDQYRPK